MNAAELMDRISACAGDAAVGAVVAYAREGEETVHPITVCTVTSVEVGHGGVVILHTGEEL